MFQKILVLLLLPFLVGTAQAQLVRFPEDFKAPPAFYAGLKRMPPDKLTKGAVRVWVNPGVTRDKAVLKSLAESLYSPDLQAGYYEVYSVSDGSGKAGSFSVLQFTDRKALEKVLPYSKREANKVQLIKDNCLITGWMETPDKDAVHRLDELVWYFTLKGATIYNPEGKPERAATKVVIPPPVTEPRYVTEEAAPVMVEGVETVPDTKPHRQKQPDRSEKNRQLERDALAVLNEKDYDRSVVLYEKLLQTDPKNSRAWYNIAWAYAVSNRQPKAIEVAQKALKVLPAEEHAEFYKMIGNCLSDLGDYKSGEDYLQRSVSLTPDDPFALYNLGYTVFKQHKYDQAVYWLNRALEAGFIHQSDSELADVYFYIGTSLGEMGRNEEALTYHDRAIEKHPYYTQYFNKAEALVRLKRYDEALRVANEGVATAPDSSEVYHKKYQVLRHMGRLEQAGESLREAYRRAPHDTDVLLDMGVMYTNTNEIPKALDMYRQGLKYAVDKSVFYSNIANIYSNNPRTRDSAAHYYIKAIEGNPGKAAYYFNFGNYYKDLEQYPRAIAQYEKAIALNPELHEPYANLAAVYADQKKLNKAREYAESGLKRALDDFELNAIRAEIAMREEAHEEAIRYATRAIENIPKGRSDASLLNIRANARMKSGQPAEALYDYLEITNRMSEETKKENYGLFSNMGYACIDQQKPQDALRYFEESLRYKEEADPAIGLMLAYYLLGDERNVEKAKARALRLEPALQQGMKGIRKMEEGDYFFSPYQKELLAKILGR